MKKYVFIILSAVLALQGEAQQKPHYTQYILNQYILNPALSGIENYIDIKASHRQQWVGVDDAPVTTYFTIQGPIGKLDSRVSATGFQLSDDDNPRGGDYWNDYAVAPSHHGIGLQVVQDKAGPLTQSAAYATYAYHLGLSPRTSLAAGFGVGVNRYGLNTAKLKYDQPSDPTFYQNGIVTSWKPDMTAGLYLYSADYFVGLSAQQIVPQRMDFAHQDAQTRNSKTVPHLFATAGYRLTAGEDFNLTPSVMVKYISPLRLQEEFNVKVQYRDQAWVGCSYRASDGFAAMLGLNVASKFNVAYSYDYTTSYLNTFSKGTHELMLGFMLNNSGDRSPRNVW